MNLLVVLGIVVLIGIAYKLLTRKNRPSDEFQRDYYDIISKDEYKIKRRQEDD